MVAHSRRAVWLIRTLLILVAANPPVASAQNKGKPFSSPFGGFGLPALPGANADNATFEAKYELQEGGQVGRVSVIATIGDNWHMYSTTQPDGGPLPTEIKMISESVKVTGPFVPDHAPEIGSNEVWPGLPIEEHHGVVTWIAPFDVVKELNPDETKLELSLDGQVCTDGGSCIPVSEKLSAKFVGNYAKQVRPTTLRVDGTQATWSAQISPAQLKPGGLGVLSLKAELDDGYHLYPFVLEESEYRTVIVATNKSGLRFGAPQTKAAIAMDKRLDQPIAYHDGDVTWQIPIKIPDNAKEGQYPVELLVGFVTCNDRKRISSDKVAQHRLSSLVAPFKSNRGSFKTRKVLKEQPEMYMEKNYKSLY